MKIALVSHAVETHSGSRAPIELAKTFVKLGHEVYFYAYSDLSNRQAKNEIESAGVKVILITSPKIKFIGRFLSALKLSASLKKVKPDIISTQATLPFILGAKLSGIPLILTYMGTQQDIWLDKIFPKSPALLDTIINKLLNFAIISSTRLQLMVSDHVITFTNFCSKELNKLYGKKAPYVFWGSIPKTLQNTKTKKQNQNKNIQLLTVSRIIPYKGFHTMIEALNELNPTLAPNLTIIGSNPNKKYLSYLKKIKSKNIKIVLNPSDKVLSGYYQQSDIYVTCDKFLFFGMPIFEAASFGKPTIAFDFASAREVVSNNKTGLIVTSKESLKKAIIKLTRSKSERLRLGNNAKKFSKNYTWENTANFYLKQFKKW